ncbi:MAG TPA: DUF1479 domain-containing protein [Alphaproteobacteria bacterium]|nr:DUF1479 domain-containing protein [Alphaproteobacteria bacterium]
MNDETQAAVKDSIVAFKRSMAERRPALERALQEMEDHIRREADSIQAEAAAGRSVVPEIDFAAIRDGRVDEATRAEMRRRGCAVVRGVFPAAQVREWNDELGRYLDTNRYYDLEKEKRGLDKYFSALKSGRPQIFGIYWSKPQMLARQDPKLAETRAFLNRLWRHDGEDGPVFDPDLECTYADRTRRREPGDKTLGLSPHMDGGSVERWIDPGFQKVYQSVFSGDWRAYDPFDARHRLSTKEIPSPAVCSMFRTYQGWTALTRQGPQDGTLRLSPLANGIAYILLRALMDDVAEDDLCGAQPGRALSASEQWHPALMATMVSIPTVEPGDTVWWHPDVVHAVGDEHNGADYANVMYIGAAPDCAKNRAYLPRQKAAFLAGKSAPDFAAEDYEVAFEGRATEADLTELGRRQMGF